MTVGYYLETGTEDVYGLEDIYGTSSEEDWRYWLNEMIDTLTRTLNFLPEQNEVYLVTAEYWGNADDGWEMNDVLGKTRINNVQDFINIWDDKTRALIEQEKIA